MSNDRRVNFRFDWQVRDAADRTKRNYSTENRHPVNIIRCLKSSRVLTDYGEKKLLYKVADDETMPDEDARTDFERDTIIITVKHSIDGKAFWGDGRSRMTLAHELGHAVLHSGAPKFRSTGATGPTTFSKTNALQSAEHQAKVFASAFLIDDKFAAEMSSPEQISAEFVVSLQAATICFDRLQEEADREAARERVRVKNEEFQRIMRGSARFLDEACAACGSSTLVAISTRVECRTCGYKIDRSTDGD
jgi:ribosomal protein S27E